MKIIYEVPIQDKIRDAVLKSNILNKKIHKLILDKEEFYELFCHCSEFMSMNLYSDTAEFWYYGVRCEREE